MTTPDGLQQQVSAAVAKTHRQEWTFVLAATMRLTGDLELAQECVQDAYVTALKAWAGEGVPRNPAAWLTVTARRKAMDAMRRTQVLTGKLPLL